MNVVMLLLFVLGILSQIEPVSAKQTFIVPLLGIPSLKYLTLEEMQSGDVVLKGSSPFVANTVISIYKTPFLQGPQLGAACRKTKINLLQPQITVSTPGQEQVVIQNQTLDSLLGHGIKLQSGAEQACANIFPESPRGNDVAYKAFFYGDTVDGTVYFFQLGGNLKIVTNLKSKSSRFAWTFAQKWWSSAVPFHPDLCQQKNGSAEPQSKSVDYMLSTENMVTIFTSGRHLDLLNSVLFLFNDKEAVVSCSQISQLSPQTASVTGSDDLVTVDFLQSTPFHPLQLRSSSRLASIRPLGDSACTTAQSSNTNDLLPIEHQLGNSSVSFLPSLTLFTADTVFLKNFIIKLRNGVTFCGLCRGLSKPFAAAEFYFKLLGSVYFAELGDGTVLMWPQLQHALEGAPETSTWAILPGTIGGSLSDLSCATSLDRRAQFGDGEKPIRIDQYGATSDNHLTSRIALSSVVKLTGPRSIVGTTTFQFSLGWYKACANVTSIADTTARAELTNYGHFRQSSLGEFSVVDRLDSGSVLAMVIREPSRADGGINGPYELRLGERPLDFTVARGACSWPSSGALWKPGMALIESTSLQRGNTSDENFEAVPERRFTNHPLLRNPLETFVGKSVVLSGLHIDGCGTILPVHDEIYRALAVFETAWIKGRVYMTQAVKQATIPREPTLFRIQLNMTKNQVLQWTITHGRSCENADTTVYNPLKVDVNNKKYAAVCLSNPRACAVGDLSTKLNRTLSGMSINTAVTLQLVPLTGTFSVSGYTMTFVSKTDPSKIACAVIEPWTIVTIPVNVAHTQLAAREHVRQKMQSALQLESHEISVSENRSLVGSRCIGFTVRVYATEAELINVQTKIEKLNVEALFDTPICYKPRSTQKPSSGATLLPFSMGIYCVICYLLTTTTGRHFVGLT